MLNFDILILLIFCGLLSSSASLVTAMPKSDNHLPEQVQSESPDKEVSKINQRRALQLTAAGTLEERNRINLEADRDIARLRYTIPSENGADSRIAGPQTYGRYVKEFPSYGSGTKAPTIPQDPPLTAKAKVLIPNKSTRLQTSRILLPKPIRQGVTKPK